MRRRLRIGVADEVLALRAVAVDHGEADAVEREADAAPRAVEAVVEHELVHAVGRLLQLGALLHRAARAGRTERLGRLRIRHAEAHHQPAEPFRVEPGIRRHQRPGERRRRRIVDLRGRHLLHHAARDVDVHGACIGAALDARVELLTLVGRVEQVGDLAERAAQQVRRHLGAVLRPVGLHHAGAGKLVREHEALVEPELARDVPRLLRRRAHVEPALVALLDDLRVGDLVRRDLVARLGPRRVARGEAGGGRHVVAVVVLRALQVRVVIRARAPRRPTCSRSSCRSRSTRSRSPRVRDAASAMKTPARTAGVNREAFMQAPSKGVRARPRRAARRGRLRDTAPRAARAAGEARS